MNTAINTIVNALQGDAWVRLLSRFATLFGVSRELTSSIGWVRMCFSTSSRRRLSSSLSQTGASVKLQESIYMTSLKFLPLLLHPSLLRSSGRQAELEKESHDPLNRGSWMALESPRSMCSVSVIFLSLINSRRGPINVTLSRVPLFYARPNLIPHTSIISVCLPKKRTSLLSYSETRPLELAA